MWCASDAGLVINPDGAINQLEGGIIQAASWALKEGVRLDSAGISSRDWEGYPVLRFTEVPEITGRAGRRGCRSAAARRRRSVGRPDRRRDRQCRRARTRRAAARPALDPRTGHGGAAEVVAARPHGLRGTLSVASVRHIAGAVLPGHAGGATGNDGIFSSRPKRGSSGGRPFNSRTSSVRFRGVTEQGRVPKQIRTAGAKLRVS